MMGSNTASCYSYNYCSVRTNISARESRNLTTNNFQVSLPLNHLYPCCDVFHTVCWPPICRRHTLQPRPPPVCPFSVAKAILTSRITQSNTREATPSRSELASVRATRPYSVPLALVLLSWFTPSNFKRWQRRAFCSSFCSFPLKLVPLTLTSKMQLPHEN